MQKFDVVKMEAGDMFIEEFLTSIKNREDSDELPPPETPLTEQAG